MRDINQFNARAPGADDDASGIGELLKTPTIESRIQ
jgi:hypothetical protein